MHYHTLVPYTTAQIINVGLFSSGTYVDPRIIPGFYYRVRPNDRKEHLFQGRALRLLSIGMGYAKRLTFQPDSLVEPNNYLWSDNHPDGLGLEPRAVHEGMRFNVIAGDQKIGEAQVFRADLPQMEETMEKVCVYYILINISFHIFSFTNRCRVVQNINTVNIVY